MSSLLQNELYSKWFSALDSARHKLLAIRRQKGIEEVKRKGIIIDREVSRRTHLEFSESEPRVSAKYRLINGKIEAYEIPLNPHGLAQGKLTAIMDNWNDQLLVISNLDVIVGTRNVYRHDISVQPRNRQQPQSSQAVNSSRKPYPTLVVEIADMETIKLFSLRQNGSVALLALLYLRNNPNTTIPVIAKSFGTVPRHHYPQTYLLNTVHVTGITGVGFGGFLVMVPIFKNIKWLLLFNGVPGGVPDNFTVDLWRLQDVVLNGYTL
ncbi:6176_t:CDS:2 [Entrophospora sp. SA101]|nr:15595_t:CDS:2 [Entrophospora sp. SA101]CAJ0823047.1 6176_t:CDS:2 [Entrophospora sp. SA101]